MNPITKALGSIETLRATENLKLENPEKFSGDPKSLINYILKLSSSATSLGWKNFIRV